MGRISNREKLIIAAHLSNLSDDTWRIRNGFLPVAYEQIIGKYIDVSRCIYTKFARDLLHAKIPSVKKLAFCFAEDYSVYAEEGFIDAQVLECFRLKYIDGLTKEQTAERLNIDARTVYRWIDCAIPWFGDWLAYNLPQKSIDDAARKYAIEGNEIELSKFAEYYSMWRRVRRLTAYKSQLSV